MESLVIIPARGGSKGVPGKNIKPLNGTPLIYYTIQAARDLFVDECIYVSTDDVLIQEKVKNFGLSVPFLRPASLATDTASTQDVLLHSLGIYEQNGYHPDKIILLQPTSPFRTSKHISEALDLYNDQLDMVTSVKLTKSNPYYVLFEENNIGFLEKSKKADFSRRQDCPEVYELNGAIYIINVESLKKGPISSFSKVKKYLMDEISSHDIDTMFDWKIAELFCHENENK